MKHLFTRLSLLIAALCFSLLSYAQAQRSEVPSATARQLSTPRFKAPSTCSSCYARPASVTNSSLQKSAKSTKNRAQLNAQASSVAAYIRSVNIPWGEGDATNTRAMEEAFGAGNWDDLFFETTSVAEVFTPARQFLYIDGSDAGPNEFNTLLRNNLPMLESWVAAGGHLFLNVAPNIGSAINFGFGGVRVNYNQGPFIDVVTVAAGHPIAAGPFQPAGNAYEGDYFAHGNLTGLGLVSVIAGAKGTVLASKVWGSGHVFFGTMTLSAFHTPELNAHNLRKNILAYRAASCTAPVVTVPESVVAQNAQGQCGALVAFQATASGSASVSYRLGDATISSPYQFPVGTTTVTATATNDCGTDSKTFTVEVQDEEAPVAVAKNISVTLSAQGEASLSAASIDNGSTDNCGIQSVTISKSTFNCQNLGPNDVVLTVLDIHGNVSTAPATVTVVGSLPTASITVTSSGSTYPGSRTTDLYLGYGPKSIKLKAAGGVSYQWNQVAGLSSTTGEEVFFTPTRGGTYTLGVVAANEFGCQASTAITVRVVDVRCGNNPNNPKVLVCHNGHEICISPNAVPAHLSNHADDRLGSCSMSGAISNTMNLQSAASPSPLEVMFEAYPNPVTENAALHFRVAQSGKARLQIFNTLGQLVTALPELEAVAGQEYEVPLSGKGLQTGMYTCRLELGGKTYSQRMVVTK